MNRCISKKDYLKKDNSNVGYALYVQDNIKKDDYAKLNTGEIVKVIGIRENEINKKAIYYNNYKVIGIRENEINKKAIYYNIYNEDWFDASAVENFSEDIIELIELGDIIEIELSEEFVEKEDKKILTQIGEVYTKETLQIDIDNGIIRKILTILTKEQYTQNCYKIDTN